MSVLLGHPNARFVLLLPLLPHPAPPHAGYLHGTYRDGAVSAPCLAAAPRQSHCRDRWLARLQLRDVMQRSYRDYKMLDWVLTQVRVETCMYIYLL